jgi:hypothetical chaperone protein
LLGAIAYTPRPFPKDERVGTMTATSIGIDFGTTNTVVALATEDGETRTLRLPGPDPDSVTHPSVLAFEPAEEQGRQVHCETGETAIRLASEHPDDFRYIQSLKSHAASPLFQGTVLFGRRRSFGDLMASFLRHSGIVDQVDASGRATRIVIGRPVQFHGETPDDGLAVSRYRDALAAIGFRDFHFAYEPVGGALSYFKAMRSASTVLIADLGGGTSDFVIARFDVTRAGVQSRILAHAGIGIAGDAFDNRIVENALLDKFGAGTTYVLNGKTLPVPRSYFAAFSKWHLLSQLRAPKYLDPLRDIERTASEPEKIRRLLTAIEENKGLAISRAVSKAKATLSGVDATDLVVDLGDTKIERRITRAAFEGWIAPDVAKLADTVDTLISRAGLSDGDVDRVFLTGGTSFIPAVNALFNDRFGVDRLILGDRFAAVAEGLALIGVDPNIDRWTAA